jgi:hypothetical protein
LLPHVRRPETQVKRLADEYDAAQKREARRASFLTDHNGGGRSRRPF